MTQATRLADAASPRRTNNAPPASASATRWQSDWRWIAVPLLALVVFVVSLLDSGLRIDRTEFHPDESRWINRSYYLRELTDPFGESWADRYLIRGQPPMGSYVTGLGLLLQGRNLDTNGPWDFRFGNETNTTWNVIKGNMPVHDDLMAARRTAAFLSALTCVALFLSVGLVTNWVGGLIAGLFLALHPLHQYLATLATSDAFFTTFVALSLLAAIWLAMRPSWWRALLLALPLAAGASTKLSPIFLAVGLGIVGAVILVDPVLRRAPLVGSIWRFLSRGDPLRGRRLSWMLLAQPALVGFLFVLSYPYLWSDPIGRTVTLFDFRRYEMANQARIWPHAAVDTRFEALDRTWHALNNVYSTSDRVIAEIGTWFGQDWTGRGIDLFLAVPGLVILLYLAWQHGLASRHSMAFAVVIGQAIMIIGGLGVDFNRYYLPLAFVAAVGVGVLSGWVAGLCWNSISNLQSRRSAESPAASSRAWDATTASARSQH
jgi:hypothetical protein